MRMVRSILFALAAPALAGCAGNWAQTSAGAVAGRDTAYACTAAEDGGNARGMRHQVTLSRDAATRRLVLDLWKGQPQWLDPVPGTSERLYANPLFAWRPGRDSGVLTDVEDIQTYSCQRLGDTAAAPLAPSNTRGS